MRSADKRNVICAVVLVAVSVAIAVALALTIAFVNRDEKARGLTDLTVNGVTADAQGCDYSARVPQCAALRLEYGLPAGAECRWFAADGRELADATNILIDGKDATLVYEVVEGGGEKTRGMLAVRNIIADDAGLSVTINGIAPRRSGDALLFELPFGTRVLSFDKIALSEFFEYRLFEDEQRTAEIVGIDEVPIRQRLYLDIYNVNKPDACESYALEIAVAQTDDAALSGVTVNGVAATREGDGYGVRVSKTTLLNIELAVAAAATAQLVRDGAVLDIATPVSIDEKIAEHAFAVRVTAAGGRVKEYVLTVALVYDANAAVASVSVNGVRCHADGATLSVLLERAERLTVDIKTESAAAVAELYGDYALQTRIPDAANIDARDFALVEQLYLLITAESGDVRRYALDVRFIPSAECELEALSVNGKPTALENGAASIDVLGKPDAVISLADIRVSRFASYKAYADAALTSEITEYGAVRVTAENPFVYIEVTAEDGASKKTYTLGFCIISDDGTLKSITVNGAEYVIKSEDESFFIESCDAIAVTGIAHAEAAEARAYYDAMQTEPVPDLGNIRYADGVAELYFRVTAQSSSVRVYRIRLTVKTAPDVTFKASTVALDAWQETIDAHALFTVRGNSYLPAQYVAAIYWNGAAQSSRYIAVDNVSAAYELKIAISSPYFKTREYSRRIQIEPFVPIPIAASLVREHIELNAAQAVVSADELIAVDCGSYALGKHFYIAVYKPDGTELVTDLSQRIVISSGTIGVSVCAVGDLFEGFSVGSITVTQRLLAPPEIVCKSAYEYAPSGDVLDVRGLFAVSENGNRIISVSVLIDGAPTESLVLAAGEYAVRVTVLYDGGTADATFTVRVAAVSDDADADVYLNGEKAEMTDGACAIETAYDETLEITAEPHSARATAALTVNGAAAELGRVRLDYGVNVLIVTVTAESGRTARYTVTATKRERALPVISTTDKTVKLTENQTRVSVADCYAVAENDYAVEKTTLYCGGAELADDALHVANGDGTYTVTVRAEGEFGALEAEFRVGVVGYSAVKITFKPASIICDAAYVFSAFDFVERVEFVGYAEPCEYEVLVNGAPFADGTLDAGEYAVTVRAWQGEILLKEQTALFTVEHAPRADKIVLELRERELAIAEETATLDFDETFRIDYGGYAPSDTEVYYVINSRKTYALTVAAGVNEFYAVVIDALTAEELFRGRFTLVCVYRPAAQSVFAALRINGKPVRVTGNAAYMVSDSLPTRAELAYELRDGFGAEGLASEYALAHGVNGIEFTVVRNGVRIACTLEIYNVLTLDKYVQSVAYGVYAANGYVIDATGATAFDFAELTVTVADARVETTASYAQIANGVYDVTVRGKYGGAELGQIVVRVFIGGTKPLLSEALFAVTGDGVKACDINVFSVALVCVTDETALAPAFDPTEERYEIDCDLTGLRIGKNARMLVVTDAATGKRYEYAAEITLFPEHVVSSVSCNGAPLAEKNGVYVVAADGELSPSAVRFEYDARIDIELTQKCDSVVFNGAVVGCDYTICCGRAVIYEFSVAAYNDNTTVTALCDGAELVQIGNDKLVYALTVDKAVQTGNIVKRFRINAMHPYTTVAGDCVSADADGYYIAVDFGAVEGMTVGSFTRAERFTAVSLGGSFEYILSVELTVVQTTETDAPLVITADGTQNIIFSDDDLVGAFAIAGKPLRTDVFGGEITLTISGTKMYNFIDNGVAKDSITVANTYFGNIEFDVLQGNDLKHVIIHCECKDADGNNIETGVIIGGEKLYITENAPVTTIEYDGAQYADVLIANGTVTLPDGAESVQARLFGYLADDNSFVFADGMLGRDGLVQVRGDMIIILMDDYGKTVPYAIIKINRGTGE